MPVTALPSASGISPPRHAWMPSWVCWPGHHSDLQYRMYPKCLSCQYKSHSMKIHAQIYVKTYYVHKHNMHMFINKNKTLPYLIQPPNTNQQDTTLVM